MLTQDDEGITRIWDVMSGEELIRLEDSNIRAVTWNPAAQGILADDNEGKLTLYRTDTGEGIQLYGHQGRIWDVTWNPDNKLILTVGSDGTARVWESTTGENIYTITHNAPIKHASWSPNGARIITADDDGVVQMWEAEDGSPIRQFDNRQSSVTHVVWSPDGGKVLVARADGTNMVWDTEDNSSPPTKLLSGSKGETAKAEWSQDGSRILITKSDNTAHVWDAILGNAPIASLYGPGCMNGVNPSCCNLFGECSILQTSLSPKSGYIFVRFKSGSSGIWSMTGGGYPIQDHLVPMSMSTATDLTNSLDLASWNASGTRVVTVGGWANAYIWDRRRGELDATLVGHEVIQRVVWDKTTGRILTAGKDGSARIWDSSQLGIFEARFENLSAFNQSIWNQNEVEQASWNNDKTLVLSVSEGGVVRVLDLEGQEVASFSHDGKVRKAFWNPTVDLVTTIGVDETIHIWDVETGSEIGSLIETGSEIGSLIEGHDQRISAASWRPFEPALLLTAGWDGKIRVWEPYSQTTFLDVSFEVAIISASWSPDGTSILVVGTDGFLQMLNLTSGEISARFVGHTSQVTQAKWNQMGTQIASASRDGTARIWDVKSGAEMARFAGHSDDVQHVSWNRDETMLLTAGDDDTVRVWEIASGTELLRISGTSDPRWIPDGRSVLATGQSGRAIIVPVEREAWLIAACERVPRNMTWREWEQFMPGQPYRVTCEGAGLPDDTIRQISNEIQDLAARGEYSLASYKHAQLTQWLRASGQQ